MSTEIHISDAFPVIRAGDLELVTDAYDRRGTLATDRPAPDVHGHVVPALPATPGADVERDQRRADVELKHQRVREFLDRTGQDAVVLGRAESTAWFTSGGDLSQDFCSEHSAALLFVNRNSRAVIADNVHSCRIFEEELTGLGFQLKERPWFDDPSRIVAELCHNKKVATDLGVPGCPQWRRDVDPLAQLRRRLTPLERRRIRELGRSLALAVEATCRNFNRGEPEKALAGHLAHRLLRDEIVPVDIRIAGDDRLARYRQPTFKSAPIRDRATIHVTGKRHGLNCSVSRTISFGPQDEQARAHHALATMIDATYIYFSRPGEPVSEVFRRSRRIYEKFNAPYEWTLDYQGVLTGYSPQEALLVPDSPMVLEPDMAVCWSPSVGSSRSEDTIVVDGRGGFEVVTHAQNWPMIDVAVKGYIIRRPGVLERD